MMYIEYAYSVDACTIFFLNDLSSSLKILCGLLTFSPFVSFVDPASVLEHALELQKRAHKAQDLEIENKKLRETLDEYNNEFAEVKNQGSFQIFSLVLNVLDQINFFCGKGSLFLQGCFQN